MVDLGTGRGREREPDRDESEDTEITLGTGKLLGIFFGLVVVCSFFFTVGYLFGRSNAAGGKAQVIGTAPSTGSPGSKPAAGDKTEAQNPSPAADQPTPATTAGAAPLLTAALPTPAPNLAASATPATQANQIKATVGGAYTVQVAAVSKREDAQSLVNALQKKEYPVFLTNLPGDPLFHVQVGPFSNPQDAETMRARLAAEGYDAIVKK